MTSASARQDHCPSDPKAVRSAARAHRRKEPPKDRLIGRVLCNQPPQGPGKLIHVDDGFCDVFVEAGTQIFFAIAQHGVRRKCDYWNVLQSLILTDSVEH